MNQLLEPEVVITFPAECRKGFRGIASDRSFLYLTLPQELKIYKFDQGFALTETYQVNRPYSAICYDSNENCFWVWAEESLQTIYRLNDSFQETGCIEISRCLECCNQLTGLSYHCEKNTLLLSFHDSVFELSKNGQLIQLLPIAPCDTCCCVLSLPPCYLVIQRRECDKAQVLHIFSADGKLLKSCLLPECCSVEDFEFYPCRSKSRDNIDLILLVSGHDNPCIIKCCFNCCDLALCPCNYECLHNCRCSARDLIESIAKIETALSHILNAEGEKLQKAVKLADNVCDLLEIDKAVNQTITKVTFLEHTLYAKLEAAISLCPELSCEKKEPCECICKKNDCHAKGPQI